MCLFDTLPKKKTGVVHMKALLEAEVSNGAKTAALLRSELDALASENSRLLGLTGY